MQIVLKTDVLVIKIPNNTFSRAVQTGYRKDTNTFRVKMSYSERKKICDN